MQSIWAQNQSGELSTLAQIHSPTQGMAGYGLSGWGDLQSCRQGGHWCNVPWHAGTCMYTHMLHFPNPMTASTSGLRSTVSRLSAGLGQPRKSQPHHGSSQQVLRQQHRGPWGLHCGHPLAPIRLGLMTQPHPSPVLRQPARQSEDGGASKHEPGLP